METELKTIKISKKNSIIEGNLAEMPLVRYGKDKPETNIITYPWVAGGKECSLEIRGSAKYGLPKEFDFDVLLALLRLYAKQKEIAYQLLIKDDCEISREDATLYFSRNELARELGKSTGGKNLKRIEEAIETLKDTSIHGKFYDKYKGKYVAKVKKGLSVIDEYQFYEVQEDEKSPGWRGIKEQTYVVFNRFYIRSIHNTYFKYYNYDQYLSIGKSGIAKKLYLLLCKWRNNRATITLKYDTLYKKIPLDLEKPDAYNKKLVKSACNKLVSKAIIHKCTFERDFLTVYFTSDKAESKRIAELKAKYSTFAEINNWFLENGFSPEDVNGYMNVFIYNIEYVKALIRYVEDNKSSIKQVKSYVKKGLRVPHYTIDHKYYNKAPSEAIPAPKS